MCPIAAMPYILDLNRCISAAVSSGSCPLTRLHDRRLLRENFETFFLTLLSNEGFQKFLEGNLIGTKEEAGSPGGHAHTQQRVARKFRAPEPSF